MLEREIKIFQESKDPRALGLQVRIGFRLLSGLETEVGRTEPRFTEREGGLIHRSPGSSGSVGARPCAGVYVFIGLSTLVCAKTQGAS